MTIYQGLTTSFKVDMLNGKQNVASDTLKMALYTAYATLDQDTTAYTTGNEISGTGYTAGGETLSNVTINSGSNTVYVSFSNVVWSPAQFTTRGALIYNATKSNHADERCGVRVGLWFGQDSNWQQHIYSKFAA